VTEAEPVAITYGFTVNPLRLVTFSEPVDQGEAEVMVTVLVPTCCLYRTPSMMLVLSCAAVSVLPAVNANLPDIYRPFHS